MGTRIRSVVSDKRVYWLPKHRYLELVHFCMQYHDWEQRLKELDGYSRMLSSLDRVLDKNSEIGKPVERIVEERMELEAYLSMVDRSAKDAALDLAGYLLKGVTEGIGYESLGVPCCKDVYYRYYRRFFWLLDKARK